MPVFAKMKRLILLVLILLPGLAFAPMEQGSDPPITFEELYLLYGYSGSDIAQFHRNEQLIWSVAWSPDQQYIAAGDVDGWLHIWEVYLTPGVKILGQDISNEPIYDFEWSQDSQYLAVGITLRGLGLAQGSMLPASGNFGMTVWNRNTETLVTISGDREGTVRRLSWLNDGRIISHGDYIGILGLWDINTQNYTNLFDKIYSWGYALSSDRQILMAVHEMQGLLVWNTTDFSLITNVQFTDRRSHWFISLSSDDRYVTVCDIGDIEGTVFLINASNKEVREIESDCIVSWSPDGHYLTLPQDGFQTYEVLEVATLSKVGEFSSAAYTWSPDSKMLVSNQGILLDLSSQIQTPLPIPEEFAYSGLRYNNPMEPYWLCDTPYILGSGADTILVWDSRTQELVNQLPVDFEIQEVVMSPRCDQFAVIGSNGFIQIFTYTITE